MIDTHSHIYSEEFDEDRDKMILRAKEAGVKHIILPNIDSKSLPRMLALEADYPDYCHATIGLHPTSVKEDFREELNIIYSELQRRDYIAIGEIGIDLYWDKQFLNEQIITFKKQLDWSIEYNIPVIIHVRNSYTETMQVLSEYKDKGLKGVFHSFAGNLQEAKEIINFGGFYLGINGIVTFKNSGLGNTISQVDLSHILLETDSPYLTPAPFRGKRNESAYTKLVLDKLSLLYTINEDKIDEITTKNTYNLFKKLT